MPNYSKGKIYKIYNDDLIYIGSTTQTLEQRLKDHLRFYKKYKLVGGCRYTSYDVLDKESYKI